MQLCIDRMLSQATFFNDPARDFEKAKSKKNEERKAKDLILRNPKTQENKDKTNAEKKVIDEELKKLTLLSKFSDEMTEIRDSKKHVDCIEVEIFDD